MTDISVIYKFPSVFLVIADLWIHSQEAQGSKVRDAQQRLERLANEIYVFFNHTSWDFLFYTTRWLEISNHTNVVLYNARNM